MRRYRRRNAKPGQLIAYYGVAERGDNPDVCWAWGGEGVGKRHGNLLAYYLTQKRVELVFGEERIANGGQHYKFGDSFLEALDKAGLDITTLRFSIAKKADIPLGA